MYIVEKFRNLIKHEQTPLDPFETVIKIAKGKARYPDRKNEKELLAHQLRAIEELGKSGRKEALDYLAKIYTPQCIPPGWTDGTWYPPDRYCYPEATGPLFRVLSYDDYTGPDEIIHRIMQTAISNLSNTLELPVAIPPGNPKIPEH